MVSKGEVAARWWERLLGLPRRSTLWESESRPEVQETFRRIHESKGFTLDQALEIIRKAPESLSKPDLDRG